MIFSVAIKETTLCGMDGLDKLLGGEGNDYLYGGPGYDILRGQKGNDTLYGVGSDDKLSGGPGNDKLEDNERHYLFNVDPDYDEYLVIILDWRSSTGIEVTNFG